MNILFIQKSTDRGGAKNSLAESLRAITRDGGIQPKVLVGGPGAFADRCETLGVPVTVVDLPEWRKFFDRLRFPSAMKRISGTLKGEGIDWVVSNEMWWGPHAARIARHLGCRSAVILRDGIATIPKALQYRLFDNDLILPVSSTIGDALTPHPELGPRVRVLFNSVSVPAGTSADAAALENSLAAFPSVRRWLLIIGKVGSRKNQVDGVRVTRSLIDEGHTDLGLLLAGDIDPDYAPEMDAAIRAADLRDRVAMIGNFDGLHALLDRAHTVLLPSFREGLPRSLVEAITVGKPAFSYPCEGVSDIFGAHLATFVSRESTPAALHRTIRDAWAAPDATAASFANVRQETLNRFSADAHLARLKSLLGDSGAS